MSTLCDPNTSIHDEWINIFVHGSVGSSMYFKYFFTLFKKDISKTSYYDLTLKHRADKKWVKNHAAQELGLKKIDTSTKNKTAAQLFEQLYDMVQHTFFPEQTCIGSYTFGWSGVVNHKQRCLDAATFYQELKVLVAQIHKNRPHIKIRIIAYSHGGNVALNMAQEYEKDPNPGNFFINELIMIATPIQQETDCYALHPFFEKAYSIYSRSDCVQKADCFSTRGIFSGRNFCNNDRCPCAQAVQQIELKITVAACNDLKKGCTTNSKKRIQRSPGHIELWYFADLCKYKCSNGTEIYEPCFESKMYRPHFPLEPLPAALLAPGIVAAIQKHATNRGHLVIDIQPDTGKAILREKYTSNKQTIDFLSPDKINSLREIALNSLPKYRLH